MLILAGLVAGLLLAAVVALFWLLRGSIDTGRRLQQRFDELQSQQRLLASELAGFQQTNIQMGEQLTVLNQQIKRLQERQQQVEQQDPVSVSYSQASRLVGLGASADDLTQACGITKAEADLLIKMHAR
ncbi:DUF2802 domain-containing protein [Halopseudomonas yangmingensis]|uniref:DUF2802 domain-containing protein n=1 Tax=Halopseudomonas yangmingensis TaxID=1720063 RepID=UPI001160D491|nr:DUF2802 domain-containing protein [Halopseudomonas yangmingensis]